MKSPEAFEKDDVCKYLASIHSWYFRPYQAGYGKSGVPDIVACVPTIITQEMVGMRVGLFCSVEVKREGKEPTVLQTARLAEITDSGGFACWGTSARVIPQLEKLPYALR